MREILLNKPKHHVFICTNDRRGTSDARPSCGVWLSNEDFKEVKHWARTARPDILCTRTGCLGYCSAGGINMLIYPEGKILTDVKSIEEIKEIISKLA